ncbi:hypothetical protein TeGR_g11879 [Tetraparma gracilis]|uniref:Uncharacterized protein n=1 Tax=Tetraparma gracilis TaxID=2962635 RepID=A0ABQ6N4X6_9STRA|nr:hypothetical protein TeGR_g11879 [Tetraparma gracilis]
MTVFGTQLRLGSCLLLAVLVPVLSFLAIDSPAATAAPILCAACIFVLGIVFAKLREGDGGVEKGGNVALVAVVALSSVFYLTIVAKSPAPIQNMSNMSTSPLACPELPGCLPAPAPPAVPAGSTCRWHEDPLVWPLDLSSSNSSSPPPSLLPSSTLRSSVCHADMDETRWDKLVSTVGNFDMIAVAAGVAPSEWDGPACKATIIDAARRATTPHCSSDCIPLGVCDADCNDIVDVCRRMVSHDVLQGVMKGGNFEVVMKGMIGDLAPCLNDVLIWVTGNGDASKICNSSFYPFESMSFGSTPNRTCLPLSTDPNTFLRDPSTPPDGDCALSKFDNFAAELANVTAHNKALDAAAEATANDVVDAPADERPWWRAFAAPGIPLLMFALLAAGDWLSVKKKKAPSENNMAAVAPVLDSDTPLPPSSSSSPSSSLDMAASLHFWSFFGLSGVFVAVALLALGVLAMFLGHRVETGPNIEYAVPQAVCFYAVALIAFFYWSSFVMYWRKQVNGLVDVKEGHVDPLAALDKIPVAKGLMKWYHDNLAIHTAGRYSILIVIAAEVFEFLVQSTNANGLAKFLGWKRMVLYGNLIFSNFLVFGICLLTPDRYIPSSAIITIDVIIDATYIMFNIFVEDPESYWAIIVPLWQQKKLCEDEFGACVWGRIEPKLYFRDGLLGGTMCGFGVAQNPNEVSWKLDVSGCGLEELGAWRKEYADLDVLDLSDNDLVELPTWLREGRMGKLRELRARGNKVDAFVDGMLGGGNTTLVEVDLRDNEIVELPYELMNVTESKSTTLLFDGNPCAAVVDWSGLGVDRLPARMVGEGYNNGGWNSSLRVLKMGRNELDESVFGELVVANFTNIEEIDVSWNALRGIDEDVRGLKKLTKLNVSGNERISAEDLVAAPEDLEMLNASFCDLNEITGPQATKLQDRNLTLHGNLVTRITWTYEGLLQKIPAWLRTLEKLAFANLEYCDVKEMKGGAFPASLEWLDIYNQASGLRLHPDSFEGLPNLWRLDLNTNDLVEDDMHPGLFAPLTRLRQLEVSGNPNMKRFDSAELFSGGSSTLDWLGAGNNGWTSGTNFHVFPNLRTLWITGGNHIALEPGIFSGLPQLSELDLKKNRELTHLEPDVFAGLHNIQVLDFHSSGLTELPPGVFDGLVRLRTLDLRETDLRGDDVSSLPPKIFSGLCGMQRLTLDGDSFHDEIFTGATLCSTIELNDDAKNACDAQADEDSVRACGCIRGACSECELEGECGGHNWCAWEADDSELGGSCSDPSSRRWP